MSPVVTLANGRADLAVGLVALLSAAASLRPLCWDADANAGAGALRVFPSVMPQGESRPSIVYHEISGDHDQGIGGHVGTRTTRYQFDCYAATAMTAVAVRQALTQALMPNGVCYRGPAGNEQILCITIGGDRSDVQSPADGSDNYKHIRSRDFLITHRVEV